MTRLLALAVALVVAGCSAAAPTSTPGAAAPTSTPGAAAPTSTPGASAPGGIELAQANVPHATGTAEDATNGARALDVFGLDLYRRLAAGQPDGNLVISPSSVALALAMARAGARGHTATEMDAVLGGLGSDEHAAWVAAIDQALNDRSGTFKDADGNELDVSLRAVNAPFAQRGMTIEPAYLDALAAGFGAGLRLVDYIGHPEAARQAINGWVADMTEQRIPQLLVPGSVTNRTRLALVNAIYLQAPWMLPFTASLTAPAPFTGADGSTSNVMMMAGGGQWPYAQGDGWRAVQIPYLGGSLAMLIIVPDDLAAFEAGLDAQTLDTITGALTDHPVGVSLPRFHAETSADLATLLAGMGMPTAFTDGADFSGITTDEALQISAVIHQANIDVDEKGTEAAAATAVLMVASGAVAEPVTIRVDRPFLFALRDVPTGAIVFMGRVTTPEAAS